MSDEHEQPQQTPNTLQTSDAQQTPPAPDQRNWVAVAPPHPYAAAGAGRQSGKGLAVSAMAIGLVALLSAGVSVFYGGFFVVVGGVLGLAALVVGIVALVKRSIPKAASITGVIAGAVALVLSVLLGVVAAVALLFSSLSGAGEETPAEIPRGDAWTPDAPQESLLDWPRNMATGGIVFEGPGDPRPVESEPLAAGTAPAPNRVDRASGNDVLVYVDYSCPHCAMFEQSSGALLEQIIADGSATVEVVPLSFMDRQTPDTYYSSRAAAAVVCLADAQPDAAWAAHNALLTPAIQPNGGPGLTNEELLELLDGAVGGVRDEARSCIENESYVPFVKALNEWVFANSVPNANDTGSRIQGTPSIFVNGEYYAGGLEDPAEFAAFYEEQTN